jgi:hypothetical protein
LLLLLLNITRPGGYEGRKDFTMSKLIYSTFRDGYGTDQVPRTMTAGELIAFLEQYDEDTPVYLSFGNGYTYGGITEQRFEESYNEEEDEE